MAPRPYQDLQELRRNGIMKGRSPGKGQRGPPPFLHPHLRKEKQLESGSRGAKVRGWRQEEAIVLGNHLESHMTHMYRQVHLSMSHINSKMQTHNQHSDTQMYTYHMKRVITFICIVTCTQVTSTHSEMQTHTPAQKPRVSAPHGRAPCVELGMKRQTAWLQTAATPVQKQNQVRGQHAWLHLSPLIPQ